jgi:RNA polymerase sigma-70 factor (ECF subfamily)
LLDESDLVQITFLEAYCSFPSFRGKTIAEFTSWLRTIALRTMTRAVKKHQRRKLPIQDDDSNHQRVEEIKGNSSIWPERKAIKNEEEARILGLLANLSSEMQQVILYRLVDDLPHKEIAKKLNKTEEATRILFFRALHRYQDLCKAAENDTDLGSGELP